MNEARPCTERERSSGKDGHSGRSGYGGEKRNQKDHPVATFLRRKFVKIAIVTLVVILLVPVWFVRATSWNKTDHLFFIERSKNKNVVQYDVQLTENNDLREPSPMVVYWVLENGRQEASAPSACGVASVCMASHALLVPRFSGASAPPASMTSA